jgi:two-component system sensor histidine kinase UhpB
MGSLDRMADDLPSGKSGRMRERLATLVGIVDRIQTANRRLLRRLRPAALGEIALADALAALVSESAQHDGAPRIELQCSGLAESYGECVDLTIYRCVQEGLTNALRHAQAKLLRLTIEECATLGALELELLDDGCGIDPDLAPGMGLTGMKERVEALGGAFTISEAPAGGTRVGVSLPLELAGRAKS